MIGRNIAHERMCVPLVRARRRKDGLPSAEMTMTCYWQNRRIAAWVKTQTVYKYRFHKEFNLWGRDYEAEALAKSMEGVRQA